MFPIIRQNVRKDTEVFTDSWGAYDTLNQEFVHDFVNHAETYVNGKVHTNGIENFWSLLKRAIRGTYVAVEPFHLFRYLDEQALRFNTRKALDGDRFAHVASGVVGKRLTYADLIGRATTPA